MLSGLPKLAVAVALAFSIGLHWGLLQSVAWVGMIVSYSQEAPLKEALSMTFDGDHPCALCQTVAAGKKAEKRSPFPDPVKKLEFAYAPSVFCFAAPDFSWAIGSPSYRMTSWSLAPPAPPPRFA